MSVLAGLGPHIWQALASLIDKATPTQLRSGTLQAAFVAMAYVKEYVIHPCMAYPWCLGQGDVAANLTALLHGPRPKELVTWKIWTLLKQGTEPMYIKEGLDLMMDCPWSTTSVEQQHASCSMVARHHPDYERESLCLKAGMHTLNRLLPTKTKEEKAISRLERKLDKVMQHAGGRLTGRQAYFKYLVEGYEQKVSMGEMAKTPGMSSRILQWHGARWRNLGPAAKQYFEEEAAKLRAASQAQRQQEKEKILKKLCELEEETKKHSESSGTRPIGFSAAHFGDIDLQVWQAEFEAMTITRAHDLR
eukprot:5552595-Lingulodinium_polyedra.AAC.1